MLPGATRMSSLSPRTPLPPRRTLIPLAIDCGSTFEPGLKVSVICGGASCWVLPSVMNAPTWAVADTKSNAITCRASSCSSCCWASDCRHRRTGRRPPLRRRDEKRFRTEVSQQDRNMEVLAENGSERMKEKQEKDVGRGISRGGFDRFPPPERRAIKAIAPGQKPAPSGTKASSPRPQARDQRPFPLLKINLVGRVTSCCRRGNESVCGWPDRLSGRFLDRPAAGPSLSPTLARRVGLRGSPHPPRDEAGGEAWESPWRRRFRRPSLPDFLTGTAGTTLPPQDRYDRFHPAVRSFHRRRER